VRNEILGGIKMSDWIDVVPAYGADYKSQKDVQAAWDSGADFQSLTFPTAGKYLNKRDAANFLVGTHIMVRYSNKRKVYEVK
jgi:hypothetical protein